jgi:hypothetical protein
MFKERNLYKCFDEVQIDNNGKPIRLEEVELYGADRVNQAKIDIIYKPCHPKKRTPELEKAGEKCLMNDPDD